MQSERVSEITRWFGLEKILDRVAARVVARTLRRTIDDQKNVCAIVATSHDLVEALRPDILVRCDFGAAEVFESSKF